MNVRSIKLFLIGVFIFRTPALGPGENANMPVYRTDRKLYTRLNANEQGLDLSIASDLRPDKMSFWNEKVPSMYNRQVSDLRDCETKTTSYVTISTGTNVWILISVCICLSVLTVVLTVGYYRLRQRVVKLLRQLSVSASGRML